MSSYIPLKGNLKSGSEPFLINQEKTHYALVDFWKWSVSDLLSNATRGRLAEFIVAIALEIDISLPRNEWDPYDLIMNGKIKIEVKSASFIQSWTKDAHSKISFSVKPSLFYDINTNTFGKVAARHADLYIFCLLKHKDKQTIDPLNLEQWDFFVLSTREIENYIKKIKTISLNKLLKLSTPVGYIELKECVLKKYNTLE